MGEDEQRHLRYDDILSRRGADPGQRSPYGPGPSRFGDLRLPPGPGPHPVAVVVHGGCWRNIADLRYVEGLASTLSRAGWATWNVEFRTLGEAGGGWPGTFVDVARAADHVRALAPGHGLDTSRVVSVGHSSGGHLALWLAGRGRIPPGSELHRPDPLPLAGAVSLAGIADPAAFHAGSHRACAGAVPELFGGEPGAVPARLAAGSPAELLPLGVPQLLLTGADDPDVPPAHVAGYAERARRAGDRVVERVVPDAGHFEVVAPWWPRWPDIEREILDFLASVRHGGPDVPGTPGGNRG